VPSRAELAAIGSIAVSVIIVGVKALAALLTGSVVVLAEVVDSLGDVVTSSVTFLALRVSRRPPDADHPYGHAKVDSLLGLLASAVLLEAEAYILVRGVIGLIRGSTPPSAPSLALGALIATSCVNVVRSGVLWSVGKSERSRALQSEAINYAWDSGRTLLVAGVLLVSSRVAPWLDPLSAILISAAVMPSTLRVAYWSASDLLDRVDPKLLEEIRSALESSEGVAFVERVRARRVGRIVLADAVIGVDPSLTADEASGLLRSAVKNVEEKIGPADVTLTPMPAGISRATRAVEIAMSEPEVLGVHSIEFYGPERDRLTLHLVLSDKMRLKEADKLARRVERKLRDELSLQEAVVHLDHKAEEAQSSIEELREKILAIPGVRWVDLRLVESPDMARLEITVGADPDMPLKDVNKLAHDIEAISAGIYPEARVVVRITSVES